MNLSRQPILFSTLLCLLLGQPFRSHGAGVAAYKEQPFHADSMARPIVYAKIISSSPIDVRLDLGGRQTALDRSRVAGLVEIPEQPRYVRNEVELEPVVLKHKELSQFAGRYTNCSAILKPYIDSYQKMIERFEGGEILFDKSWISKEHYGHILKRQQESEEAARRQDAARMEQLRIERQKQEAYAKTQREKGLELYRGEWLPRAQALARLEEDRQDGVAREQVRTKSIFGSVYTIFQVLREGMLIKPLKGQLENSGINVEIAFLAGVVEASAADGDFYKGDLYWCGNFTYQNAAGIDSTVNAYCLNKTDAIHRVRQFLLRKAGLGRDPSMGGPLSGSGPDSDGPLRGAKSSGSGFFVGTDGYFITNAHVVNEAAGVSIYYNGNVHRAEVVKVSKMVDLALLKIPLKVDGFEISIGEPRSGVDVYVLGYPAPRLQGLDVKVTKGVISSTKGLQDDDTQFQIDAAVQPGNSGGPICDSFGRLIGVVVAGLNQIAIANTAGFIPQNVNYGIKASEVSALLRTKSVEDVVPKAADPTTNDQASFIKTASGKTGLVIVQ